MSCQADDLLNANHLILTNHSAYQLIFIIQAYLLCVLLYSSLNRASSLTLLARQSEALQALPPKQSV